MFNSEIRPSQITELLEKVHGRNYGKYLYRLHIQKARSFEGKTVTFDFPVTAIVGPNGGGKTTILGAAACAYKSIKPSLFFAKSGLFDASMQNWKFEYEAIDKEKSAKATDLVRRTASFSNYKWSRDALDRPVIVFGVSRTVPATERPELKRCISGKFEVGPEKIIAIKPEAAKAVAGILDKDVSAFTNVMIDARGRVTMLAGKTPAGNAYSEFHFGAGESSVIRIAMQLEGIPENSLVVIEEIENGLHPVATMRMVDYLIELALRRKIQVILTTHSNDALRPLPDKAIWAAANGSVYQGKLDIGSLRAITGQVDSALVIFVEDAFAKAWVEEILRAVPSVSMDALEVHAMGGDGTAVRVHLDHNINPAVKQKSICIIDGDSSQKNDDSKMIFRLPGGSPESYIFERVAEKVDDLSGELAVALLRPYEEQQRVTDIIQSVKKTNKDPHLLYSQVGKKLGLIPEARVREAFMTIWARAYPEEVKQILEKFEELIPLDSALVPLPNKSSEQMGRNKWDGGN